MHEDLNVAQNSQLILLCEEKELMVSMRGVKSSACRCCGKLSIRAAGPMMCCRPIQSFTVHTDHSPTTTSNSNDMSHVLSHVLLSEALKDLCGWQIIVQTICNACRPDMPCAWLDQCKALPTWFQASYLVEEDLPSLSYRAALTTLVNGLW